ncbi:MAG TPA: hypothetical protein DHV69_04925 [Sphaerochaeta sp.]|nr:MAG: hypothetical protein A2Y31_10510 [Spirochaetes bacterium GWC2_52_13]HCG65010.1 hypothetical protein [Sphaerochaeta sp.]HCJ94556.1 hypothetical protein [Sphaerochaeta sp.]
MHMKQDSPYFSLSEFISSEISKQILQGTLNAGEKLVEAVFQEKYQVSKSPVREAFQMLIYAGLVDHKNRRGCFVKVITPDEIENIYEVRITLEGLAAKEAYIKMSREELKHMMRLYKLMENDVAAKDAMGYLRHHTDFQRFFGEVSGNTVLVDICEKLRVQNIWYNTQFFQTDLEKDFCTHMELMGHFTDRDLQPGQVEKLMCDHIRLGLENFKAYVRKTGDRCV